MDQRREGVKGMKGHNLMELQGIVSVSHSHMVQGKPARIGQNSEKYSILFPLQDGTKKIVQHLRLVYV